MDSEPRTRGKLTFVCEVPPRWAGRAPRFWCFCACGGETLVTQKRWRYGKLLHCGCLRRRPRQLPGHDAPERKAWRAMKARCDNPASAHYGRYGGRGIRVCSAWAHDFAAFFRDVGPRPSNRHSLDRIDNDRGYEPDNVRWALRYQQSDNRCVSDDLTIDGVTRRLTEWARDHNLSARVLRNRVRQGYPPESWLRPPKTFVRRMPGPTSCKITLTLAGETRTLPEWADLLGIARPTLYDRIRRGMPTEDVLRQGRVPRR